MYNSNITFILKTYVLIKKFYRQLDNIRKMFKQPFDANSYPFANLQTREEYRILFFSH